MDVTEALEQKRRELRELEEHRGLLEMERRALAARIADIDAQLKEAEEDERVLRRVAAQYNLPAPNDGLLPREVQEWQQLPRTAAVERVLEEADRPLSPLAISQVLHKNGRDDSGHNVSAALAHLKLTKRAQQAGRSQWVHPRREDPQEDGPAPDADERPLTGMELIERQLGGRAIEEIPDLRSNGNAT